MGSGTKRVSLALCMTLFCLSFLIGVPALFTSLPISNATSAAQLSISVAPSLLLANSTFNAIMTVQLWDINSGVPMNAVEPVQVIITSNNTAVAKAPASPLYIRSGMSYAAENLTAGGAQGSANITASAQGYLPTSYLVTARNPFSNPSFVNYVVPYFAPSKILSNNATYPKMVVGELQAINESSGIGYPEPAPSGGVQVWARSSDNATMQVSTASYAIVQGSVYATFNLTSAYFPGSVNITLQANNWNSFKTEFTSYESSENQYQGNPYFYVYNTITPTRVLPGESFKVQVFAQTVGAPITSAGANLTWSSNEANLTSSESNLNSTGDGSATFIAAKQSGIENIQVSIKEGGITPYLDNVSVDAYLNNMSVTITNQHPSIVTNYPTTITVHAVFNGTGVSNATITWVASNGTLINPPSLTNKTGYAIVTYQSGAQAGNFSIAATLSKFGFANATEKLYVSVVKAVTVPKIQSPSTNPLYTKVGNILPVWALIPIVAGGAWAGFFAFKRFRSGGDYYGDEE